MSPKFEPVVEYESDDPEFDYLVNLLGSLVPIAKIIMIGQVYEGIAFLEIEDGSRVPLWGFPVMLTDSRDSYHPKDNQQVVYDSWDTREEAETQRRNLATQVNDYYKSLLGK